MRHYALDADYLTAMIEAQRRDLTGAPMASFDELYQYCYGVASTVGFMCVTIWGHDGAENVAKLAECRGIALQLTNILRDLREDALAGRVYLPEADLQHFGVDRDDLCEGPGSERFDALMQFQIERVRRYYHASASLEQHLIDGCAATSDTLRRLYHTLLQRIASDPRQVLHRRVSLGAMEKLKLARHAWRRRNRLQTAVTTDAPRTPRL
jgi:phytoene synthase